MCLTLNKKKTQKMKWWSKFWGVLFSNRTVYKVYMLSNRGALYTPYKQAGPYYLNYPQHIHNYGDKTEIDIEPLNDWSELTDGMIHCWTDFRDARRCCIDQSRVDGIPVIVKCKANMRDFVAVGLCRSIGFRKIILKKIIWIEGIGKVSVRGRV